jgi:hypothetical protein
MFLRQPYSSGNKSTQDKGSASLHCQATNNATRSNNISFLIKDQGSCSHAYSISQRQNTACTNIQRFIGYHKKAERKCTVFCAVWKFAASRTGETLTGLFPVPLTCALQSILQVNNRLQIQILPAFLILIVYTYSVKINFFVLRGEIVPVLN